MNLAKARLPGRASRDSGKPCSIGGPAPHPGAMDRVGALVRVGGQSAEVWSRAHLPSTATPEPPSLASASGPPVLYLETTEGKPLCNQNERWSRAKKKKKKDHLVCCFSQSRCQRCFFRTNEATQKLLEGTVSQCSWLPEARWTEAQHVCICGFKANKHTNEMRRHSAHTQPRAIQAKEQESDDPQ